jgi:hypothetical protein
MTFLRVAVGSQAVIQSAQLERAVQLCLCICQYLRSSVDDRGKAHCMPATSAIASATASMLLLLLL